MKKYRNPFGTLTVTESSKVLIDMALNSGRLTSGRLVRRFEERFARKVGAKYAVAVSSGTDALLCALIALKYYSGHELKRVVVPALTYTSTFAAALYAGLKITPVDINLDNLLMDYKQAQARIKRQTEHTCLLPVHLMGNVVNVFEAMGNHTPWVVEDAAEAHGSIAVGKRHAGTIGDMGCYSTYAAHMVTTVDGGVVVTDNPDLAELLRSIRAHGRGCTCIECVEVTKGESCDRRYASGYDRRFQWDRIGISAKMNELEAAIGLGSLDRWDDNMTARKLNYEIFCDAFSIHDRRWIKVISINTRTATPHAIPLVLQTDAPFTRDDLMLHLEAHHIGTRTLFGSLPTQHSAYSNLGYRSGDFPNAEYVGRMGLHIGCHEGLESENMYYAAEVLTEYLSRF